MDFPCAGYCINSPQSTFPAWFLHSVYGKAWAHVVAYISTSSFFMTNVSVHGCTVFRLSIHPLRDIEFFSPLATVNNTVMNTQIQVFLWTCISSLAGDIARVELSWITWLTLGSTFWRDNLCRLVHSLSLMLSFLRIKLFTVIKAIYWCPLWLFVALVPSLENHCLTQVMKIYVFS